MKKYILYTLLIAAFSVPVKSQARTIPMANMKTANTVVTQSTGNVTLTTEIDISKLDLRPQEMAWITPVLYSADDSNSYEFDPVIVAGRTRYIVIKREIDLGNAHFVRKPYVIVKSHKRNTQSVPLTLSVPYEPWMTNSKLVLKEELTGCNCEREGTTSYLVMTPVLPKQYVPRFEISYITPPREEVKQRSETYAAHINFEVGRHVILPNYKNNREVLSKVDEIVKNVSNDTNINISGFRITGYASPEGNFQSNMTLSKNRAEAFVLYLLDRYKIVPSQISIEWKGEDWQGLRDTVAQTNITNRASILEIIDNESDIALRKAKIKQLSNGQTYAALLRDYYPPLRRNEYTITFTVKDFDLEEARQMIKTKPQYLSQQEMYLVAQSYPSNSADYSETFETIRKYFPDDEIARLNVSAAELQRGLTASQVDDLRGIERPEAWNNLGIAYYNQKEYEKAAEYFRRASDAGSSAAANNLNELQKAM